MNQCPVSSVHVWCVICFCGTSWMYPTDFNDVGFGVQPEADRSGVAFITYAARDEWEDTTVKCAVVSLYLSSFN